MNSKELASAIELALVYDVDDEGDTDGAIEMIFDGVIRTLQRNARFPRLTRADYELLFADLMHEAREALSPYWKIDTELAAGAIADAVMTEMHEERDHEHREAAEAD